MSLSSEEWDELNGGNSIPSNHYMQFACKTTLANLDQNTDLCRISELFTIYFINYSPKYSYCTLTSQIWEIINV